MFFGFHLVTMPRGAGEEKQSALSLCALRGKTVRFRLCRVGKDMADSDQYRCKASFYRAVLCCFFFSAGIFIFRLAYTICIGIIWCFLPVYADAEFSLSSSSIGILVMLFV